MSPKKPAVRFGAPTAVIPVSFLPVGGRTAPHWQAVADHTAALPGVWHPVTVGHLTADRHRQVVTGINRAELAAFRAGGFRAAFRDGQLFVRYDTPAAAVVVAPPAAVEPTPIRRKRTAS